MNLEKETTSTRWDLFPFSPSPVGDRGTEAMNEKKGRAFPLDKKIDVQVLPPPDTTVVIYLLQLSSAAAAAVHKSGSRNPTPRSGPETTTTSKIAKRGRRRRPRRGMR